MANLMPDPDGRIGAYLSEKLHESHRAHGRLLVERDLWQVRYEVLRDLALTLVNNYERVGHEEEAFWAVKRMREVLGLTQEATPLDDPENHTHDYQTGWAEDGPVPADAC